MTYTVFHYEGPSATFSERAFAEWPVNYRLVAAVEAESFEPVFELTNHLDEPWTDGDAVTLTPCDAQTLAEARAANPRVNSSIVLGIRSTSVGDIIVDADGIAHGVCGMGFKTLGALRPLVKAQIEAVRAAYRSGELTGPVAVARIDALVDARTDVEYALAGIAS